ncbi:MAG: class I SAM-dependent methyltransferase [Pyrinomonadaceae bacterium]
MSKTEKELAFLQDLYIATDWTERFTELLGKNFNTEEFEDILYINAGTGNYALDLEEKVQENTQLIALTENEELLKIAQAKADVIKSDIVFTALLPARKFDAVIADASLVKSSEIESFMSKAADSSRWQIAFLLPTAGSFGDVFSYIWQVFFELDWLDKGTEVENLMNQIPTVSRAKEITESLGFKKIEAKTKNENFEFENGTEFIESPLVKDFLFENWLGFLSEIEKEQVSEKLANTIDTECEGLTFRFSIKATLVTGAKE